MISIPLGHVCDQDCVMLLISNDREKKQEQALKQQKWQKKQDTKQKKQWAKEKREFYGNKLSHQHKLTQQAFNRMRVLEEKLWFKEREIKPYCISCEATHLTFCCGHYSSRGAYPEHRYSRVNTYLQCNFRCNSALSANKSGDKTSVGYDKGLVKRFGEEKAREIIEECTKVSVKKWTCEELKSMRKEFNAEIRRLLRDNGVTPNV